MGMTMSMRRLVPGELLSAIGDPEYGGRLSTYVPMPMPPAIVEKMREKLAAAPPERRAAIEKRLQDAGDPRALGLDKAWHLIHFLLSGATSMDVAGPGSAPAAQIILGIHKTAYESGYGPALYLFADEVQRCATVFSSIPDQSIQDRLINSKNVEREIYGGVWSGNEKEGEMLLGVISRVRTFFTEAADAGDGIFKAIT